MRKQPTDIAELIDILHQFNAASAVSFIAYSEEEGKAILFELNAITTGEQVFKETDIHVGTTIIILQATKEIKAVQK